ncbi:FAD/NAD(P)-binding domain-containing protein [Roridomyces roridus]|uniref:FAD/NAD(P)-binding domain-containing protein n=1 Tax=Roridomyces roridus TaxID=1738132 RepID=A0AAD7CB32_9AGAR|nr:FAD/NAD(P)-binding domain-containing protein [Roridomyces roridus]
MIGPLPSSTEVCIVGAGPSGLACALSLAARQIPFVIVDALAEGHNDSRAVLMQASSLEALAAINPQLSADIVATGIQSTVLQTIDLQERPVFRLRMTDIAAYTKYPFCLLTPQHKVEEQMRQYIGNKIHWNKRLVDLKEDGSKYELQFESGEVLTARYIVAADGSKSHLRSLANIRFLNPYTNMESSPGSSSDLSFVVADVLLSSPLPANIPRDTLQMMVGGGGVVLTAPMLDTTSRSSNLFRLYLGVPDTPPRNPDAAYLQTILDARGPGSHLKTHSVPQIARVLHSSRFRTRPALADRYVQRAKGGGAYILLVGDAAHKHGPAGGQGMNMGICDGVSAAQAIDEHRNAALGEGKGRDAVEIMDGYSTRRRAVAREVIDMVEGMTELEKGGAGWIPYLRVTALWMMFKMPFVNGMLAWKLSGLGHAKKP